MIWGRAFAHESPGDPRVVLPQGIEQEVLGVVDERVKISLTLQDSQNTGITWLGICLAIVLLRGAGDDCMLTFRSSPSRRWGDVGGLLKMFRRRDTSRV